MASKNTTKPNKKKQSNSGTISRRKNKNKKRILVLVIILIILAALGVIAAFYCKNAAYFKEHFYHNTVINGVDCSDMTVDEAKETIQNSLNQYTFTFTDHEGRSNTIDAASLGVSYKDDGEVEQLLAAQNYWMWVFDQSKDGDYQVTAGYTYDQDALNAWIEQLPCVADGTAPTDAYEMELADGYYRVIGETEGDEIDLEALKAYITAAVDNAQTSAQITLGQEGIFVQPSVRADDAALTAQVETKNKEIEHQKKIESLTNAQIALVSSVDIAYLDSTKLKEMITDDDPDKDPELDKDKLVEWVNKWAQDRGFLSNNCLFLTHDNKLVEVPNGTIAGWSLDVDATAQKIYDAVLANEFTQIIPILVDDSGKKQSECTYVEICIEQQNMWFYTNGSTLVDTPVVTGDSTKGYDTPSDGVWYIYAKYTNYTMRGEDYETFVQYAMPFNGQIFIHDLATRVDFGGTVYQGSGSHGCINTPFDAVLTIFNTAEIGTPVVVHTN